MNHIDLSKVDIYSTSLLDGEFISNELNKIAIHLTLQLKNNFGNKHEFVFIYPRLIQGGIQLRILFSGVNDKNSSVFIFNMIDSEEFDIIMFKTKIIDKKLQIKVNHYITFLKANMSMISPNKPIHFIKDKVVAEYTLDEGIEEITKWLSLKKKPSHRLISLLQLIDKGDLICNGSTDCKCKGVKIVLSKSYDVSYHYDLYTEDDKLMTIDHIKPKSKGGANHIDNYQIMCYKCNEDKGSTYTI